MNEDAYSSGFLRLTMFNEGVINMKEVPTKEERPLESWTKLIEKTMSGYPLTQAMTSATQNGREDPWTTVINRLWEVNPSAN